ncbi:ABC transporter substrate-binding protein [Dysosmobacter sp.]|uniref:ABC transporter substrate-binding protein n=1 Tax=Dysosmobacter sp. TaxID=2591382 RepID=UPI002A9DE9DE|nr:ABC transporter substrate-binding protein [Dysosmobacter sp.]MDY5612452.1 ABC transporter substrate-binding protein [Dysosmobacter sp.]
MKKKFFALMMTMVMVLSLAACGGKAETSAPADSNTPAQSGETAEGGSTFKLGTIGPLTGDAAIYGQAVANGAKIAVDEINASDSAIKFEFQSEDDVADGETSVNAYNTLMDWGMQVMVGPTTTGASIAVAAKAAEERTFMLTPSASSTDVIAPGDNVFQVCFTDPNQGIASADYMADNMSGAKIAVIYRNDDAYSQGIRDTFVSQSKANNLEVVYEGTFTADTATDFSVQLTAAQAAGADTVFLPIYYQPASVILTQAAAMNYAPTFFGVDGMDGILTMEGFDTALAEGVMLLTPFSADASDERTQNFVKAYQAAYGEIPNQFAADAYDGVYIVKAALEAAGCTGDMSATDICEALVGVMSTISVDGLTGQGMTWAATGEVSKAPMAVVIENGTYVLP